MEEEQKLKDPLVVVDELMGIVEEIERSIGEIASKADEGESVSRGQVYKLYTLMVRLRDKIRELRQIIYLACG